MRYKRKVFFEEPIMSTNEFLILNICQATNKHVRPVALLASGELISIQASSHHYYCSPQIRLSVDGYTHVEVSMLVHEPLLREYQKTHVENLYYAYARNVPIQVVDEVIEKHGGIVGIEIKDKFLWKGQLI